MTDTMPEAIANDETESWDGSGETYPEWPKNPNNHRFTISFDGRGPMVVVRGNTAQEIIAGFQELEQAAAGAAMGNAWASIKAAAAVASGLGATPVPAGAPAVPQAPGVPTPPPFGPNVSVPQAPGFQGNPGFTPPPAPAAPQGGNSRDPKPRPPWPQVYKISIARGDTTFKDYRAANQQYFKGKVQWAGGGDYWIHGEVAQAVAQWNPIPA